MITTADITAHLVHPIAGAPHLAVCTCGETFYAAPGVATAFEVWAAHLAETLNVALTGAQGPQ